MRSTDPTSASAARVQSSSATHEAGAVSGGSAARVARRSGRRAAVLGETAPLPTVASVSSAVSPSARTAGVIDPAVSPRRAARAAREAAAAMNPAMAPSSPVVAPTAAIDLAVVAPDAAPTPVAETEPTPAAAAAPVAEPTAAAVAAPAAAAVDAPTAAASVEPVTPIAVSSTEATPVAPVHTLAALETTAVGGRRQTFVPATAGEAHRRGLAAGADSAAARRRAALANRAVRTATPAASATTPRRASRVGTAVRRVAIVGVVAGILATTVLPVLEHTQGAAYAAGNTGAQATTSGTQALQVQNAVSTSVAGRDSYTATSVLDYEQQVIANREAASNTTYTGPSAAEYVANPLYSHTPLDRAAVFQVALQYLGTPYVHGGADPSAFDCSGFIMFVYAKFGISLAHYVPTQNEEGTTIPESEAVPGDLVVFDNGAHDGFYAGNGMILDAPKPGGVVSVRPIWNQAHHFVRIGS